MSETTATQQTPSRFLRRLTLATAWGAGPGGFDLGIFSVVPPLLRDDLDAIGVGGGPAFCVVKAIICWRWAPETGWRPLAEAARGQSGALRPAPAEAS
jgi:hypothetical protein